MIIMEVVHHCEANNLKQLDEFTEALLDNLVPSMYKEFAKLYKKALELERKYEEAKKKKSKLKNPGVLVLFQDIMKNFENLNHHHIEEQTKSLRSSSGISEMFDDLIRAVIKANIIMYTFNASGKTSLIVEERYHDNVDIDNFIHKCFLKSADVFLDMPQTFYHKYQSTKILDNKRKAYDVIRRAIKAAIREIVPMKLILEEYNKKDFSRESRYGSLRERVIDYNGDRLAMEEEDYDRSQYDNKYDEGHEENRENREDHAMNGFDDGTPAVAENRRKMFGDQEGGHDRTDEDILEQLIVKGSSDKDNNDNNNKNDGDKDAKMDAEEKPKKRTKNVVIDFGGRKTAASKIFDTMISNHRLENNEGGDIDVQRNR